MKNWLHINYMSSIHNIEKQEDNNHCALYIPEYTLCVWQITALQNADRLQIG